MFIYKIHTALSNQTYLYGITILLNKLLKNNPGWSYSLIYKTPVVLKEAHLTIIDFTTYENIREITQEEYKLIQEKKGYKVLVLLNNEQSALASTLEKFYTCSLLCIDEMHFHVRELVESSLKKRRFLSAMISKMIAKHNQLSKEITFTAVEMRILSGLQSGKKGTELSDEFFRSQKTISTHKRRIMKKLGVKDDLSLKLIMENIDYGNGNIET